jgi:hypothetical protein
MCTSGEQRHGVSDSICESQGMLGKAMAGYGFKRKHFPAFLVAVGVLFVVMYGSDLHSGPKPASRILTPILTEEETPAAARARQPKPLRELSSVPDPPTGPLRTRSPQPAQEWKHDEPRVLRVEKDAGKRTTDDVRFWESRLVDFATFGRYQKSHGASINMTVVLTIAHADTDGPGGTGCGDPGQQGRRSPGGVGRCAGRRAPRCARLGHVGPARPRTQTAQVLQRHREPWRDGSVCARLPELLRLHRVHVRRLRPRAGHA